MKPIKSQYGDFRMISRVESTDGNPIKITLNSRYGVPRTLEVLDENQGFFCLYGESRYIRQSTDMFDFEGGPFVMIGEQFLELGTVTGISQQPQTGMTPPSVEMAMVFITIEYNDKHKKILAKGNSLFELEEADANNKKFKKGRMK
jgi:hypothetical protein